MDGRTELAQLPCWQCRPGGMVSVSQTTEGVRWRVGTPDRVGSGGVSAGVRCLRPLALDAEVWRPTGGLGFGLWIYGERNMVRTEREHALTQYIIAGHTSKGGSGPGT
ncbi:hypothetical protein NDU88_007265 [Pleurodeles waltl]|uniref:Uncharacterized protein n=1 Tax=Pleurodeles waltl TaxID=8319 RepID=A0AAV7QR39_PLEWA|nr:hypothetical protein NDU88_007265 [Pleurodeles waltl]